MKSENYIQRLHILKSKKNTHGSSLIIDMVTIFVLVGSTSGRSCLFLLGCDENNSERMNRLYSSFLVIIFHIEIFHRARKLVLLIRGQKFEVIIHKYLSINESLETQIYM